MYVIRSYYDLPDIEGSEFIAMMREKGLDTPVIYLSAKDSKYQIEEGFRRGADDYMTKPFEMTELILRITSYNVCYTKLLRSSLWRNSSPAWLVSR